ncbi:MAG: CoA ester lyase [Nocardioides sp.]|uniref:HpcH/HpaI aldolase/citrate lyase family protein n=1 Tax=Nocardioides sp. TaxID=35761 RepID=UPI0039E4D2DC
MREIAEVARTWLFVPGDRPERFDKAAAAGADIVILDLEDAVSPGAKQFARDAVVTWVGGARTPFAVRINAVDRPGHKDDLATLAGLGRPTVVMLPKAEDPGTVAAVLAALPVGSAVVALIETALGVIRATDIAQSPGVVRLAFGSYDFAAGLGVDPDHPPALAAARSMLVLASAVAQLEGPVDGVTGDVYDHDRLVADVEAAVALGFAGKLCVHPTQVSPAASALAPTAEEVAWAAKVLAAVSEGGGQGVVLLDGRMVDAPVIARAKRLRRTGEAAVRPSAERPRGAAQQAMGFPHTFSEI